MSAIQLKTPPARNIERNFARIVGFILRQSQRFVEEWIKHLCQWDGKLVDKVLEILGQNDRDEITRPLFEILTTPFIPTIRVKSGPAPTTTHSGADSNQYYMDWRIIATYSAHVQRSSMEQVILKDLARCTCGPYTLFPLSLVCNEAGVNDCIRFGLLDPTLQAMTELLRFWCKGQTPPCIEVRARTSHWGEDKESNPGVKIQMFVDHAFVISEHKNGGNTNVEDTTTESANKESTSNKNVTGERTDSSGEGTDSGSDDTTNEGTNSEGTTDKSSNRMSSEVGSSDSASSANSSPWDYLVLIEEKTARAVMMQAIDEFKGKGAVLKDAKDNLMPKHLAQMMKYVRCHDCKYSVLTDALTLIAMEWETPLEKDKPNHEETMLIKYSNMEPTGAGPGRATTARLSMIFLLARSLADKGWIEFDGTTITCPITRASKNS